MLVNQARQAIESGDIEQLGRLMTRNHGYLRVLTVSSPELDALVQAALDAGALGAKLSGGGRGGNMIALVTAETKAAVRAALLSAGAKQVFETTVG
jgi:mevalonate kinase